MAKSFVSNKMCIKFFIAVSARKFAMPLLQFISCFSFSLSPSKKIKIFGKKNGWHPHPTCALKCNNVRLEEPLLAVGKLITGKESKEAYKKLSICLWTDPSIQKTRSKTNILKFRNSSHF